MRLSRWAAAIGMVALMSPAVGLLESAASPPAPYARERSQHGVGARLPLEPTRAVELTTDAVTWMSLDVSPDGRTIVFATLGDLYLMPISGGHAQRISSGMALDTQPRFSPDGSRIVFSSDRSGSENLWTLEVGKTINDSTVESTASGLRALTAGRDASYASPEWSPDGSTVVASRTDRFTWIDVMHTVWSYPSTEGPGTQLLIDNQPIYGMGGAFGPDGALYVSHRSGRDNNPYGHRIDRFDPVTGTATPITAPAGGAVRPAISPDGRWLVYASRHDSQTGYRLRDLKAETERWLAFPVQHDLQENNWMGTSSDHMPGYAFVPDSSAIIAAIDGRPHRIDLATGARTAIEFTADISLPIGPLLHFATPVARGPLTVRSIRWPSMSPDGTKLAFAAIHRVWIQDIASGKASPVVPLGELPMDELQAMPAWSHDGAALTFVTWSDFEGGHLYRVAADGSDLRRISRQASYFTEPVWVPGDREILATRGPWQQRGENLEWVRIPTDGGPRTVVAAVSGQRPHFADRDDRFYAYDPDDGLFSLALDGSDRQTHLAISGWREPLGPGGPRAADAVVMGPDGAAALALADMRLFHVPIPSREAPLTLSVAEPPPGSGIRRLDELGVDFFGWNTHGGATWSLGNAVFEWQIEASDAAPTERRVEIKLPRDRVTGTLVLRGARILTMDPVRQGGPAIQHDGIIDDGAVVIVDERITRVGRSVEVATPDGAHEIDISGSTLLPGFVDLHAHLRAARGMHRNTAWDYLNYLAHGVTTTRNAADDIDVMTYSDLVEIGAMVGPRTFSTGRAMYPDVHIGSLQDARDLMRRYREYYGHHTIKQYLTGDRTVRQWMAIAAREYGLTPTTEGVDMKTMITQVIDGYSLEHVLPHFPLAPDVVQLLVQSGTYYDPTLVVGTGPRSIYYWWTRTDVHDDPKVRRFTPHEVLDSRTRRVGWFHDGEFYWPEHSKDLATIVEAGGKVTAGSHGEMQGISFHWEMWNLGTGGMSALEVLRAATLTGAEGIGFGDDLGSITIGKLADMLVLDADPVDDLRNTTSLRYVIKGGRLYDADTLDEQWPRKRPLGPLYWHRDRPEPSE